ncbi:DNA replication helicase [Rhynchospora pubera]|uniref:DNA replication ATP-dependent helicase/nuclease n=1 Tax=Rhynchospora pubera TaxID=906938 RepID=A0AAV8G2D1_9POAL|nr:DNA replication helicase [Rhynchospora pubera]
MAPRKRTAASRKTSQSNQPSEPAKFGIQHFFERHLSQASASASTQNPKPDPISDPQSSPKSKSESDLSTTDQVPPPDESKVDDGFSEISPEASKRAPPKRFKFSPGMIIKQSQDDGGDVVTWKVSPVNERLRSLASKHLPRTTRVFAEATEMSGSILQSCSETISESPSTFTMSKLKSWLSSKPDLENNDGLKESQSPFRTPPSLPYSSIALKADVNGGAGLVEHQKDLMTLLDQVKDAIVEESGEEMEESDTMACSLNHTFVQENTKNESTLSMNGLPKQKFSNALPNETYLVLEVSEKHKGEESSCGRHPFKILRLLNEQSGTERALYLYDEWFHSPVAPGNTVNVIGEFNDKGKCIVDCTKNLLIVHPDVLISGTRVASSFTCSRRAVLDERLKVSESSISALIGTLLHQVFQEGLITRLPSKHYLEEHAKQILQKNLESLYACGANEKDILSSLIEVIPQMLAWFTSFMEESENSSIDFGQFEEPKVVSVNETIDIEEMAWAPRYGLKGMIDASLNVRIQSSNGVTHERVLPLEFKTGKGTTGRAAAEHAAQVILYTLLMSERYLKNNIDMGLIYYLRTNQTVGIKVQRSDLVGLVMRRNELASEILKASTAQSFPPMLQSATICTGCRHLNACGIYHKANGGNSASSGLGGIFDNLVNHLTPAHCNFLKLWDRLIDLEAQTIQVTKKEIWRPSSRQEKSAGSISSLVLDTRNDFSVESSGKCDRYIYQFVRQKLELDSDDSSMDILEFSFKRGDCVVLSTESGRIAVATGVIKDISRLHVSVSLSRRLRLPGSELSQERELLGQEMWRIDKDEFTSSYGIMRFNLVQLFFQNSRSLHLRKLIVDLQAPRFESGGLLSQDPAISYVRSEMSLNDDQRRSIHRILAARDYALILGMPGTGKTHTMAHAVKALLIRGASVLLTSFTNSAVDNLLLKLKSENIDFIRIGRIEAVHHEIREHCFSGTNAQSLNEIKQRMESVQVVGVTCLAINHPLLTNKKFDVCIMDEAGQITLPVSLGPLMFASKFVLVGDHYQLPPLVQSTEARENGMGISLFWRLSEAHPNAISALQCQYRMCTGIMELSNSLIYGNRLRCGSTQVALAKLDFCTKRSKHPWLNQILDPDKPAIFVNTDKLPALEERENKAVNNPAEAHMVSQAVADLINRGINEEEVGVITPYNSQATLIKQLLISSVEVHTIDRYQGRDKDCVVVSFVRSTSGDSRANSSLLGDWHRINVVLTRAKKKLIMIGSQKTLSRVPLLKLLIEKIDALGGVVHVTKKDIQYLKMLKKCSQTDAC